VGLAGCPIVRGLGGGVDDHFDAVAVLFNDGIHCGGIADVDVVVTISLQRINQLGTGRRSGRFGSEEACAHIIVNAGNLQPLRMESPTRFGANKAR